jgi:hypothetical protein
VRHDPPILDYQPPRNRVTRTQRVMRVLADLAGRTLDDGTPVLPFVLALVPTTGFIVFMELQEGPLWMAIVTTLPPLGVVGWLLWRGSSDTR